jgi:hypothetical protein
MNEMFKAELAYDGHKTVIARKTKEALDSEVYKYVANGYTVVTAD